MNRSAEASRESSDNEGGGRDDEPDARPKRGPAVPLVPLIKAASEATRQAPGEFLEGLAKFCGGAKRSVPSRAIILGHVADVKANDLTKGCSHRFADLIRSFLHAGWQAKDFANSTSFKRACDSCDEALNVLRELRYGPMLSSDPGAISQLEAFTGVYGVWRHDTAGQLRQELLVLQHKGKGAGRTYATMIS